MTREDIIAFQQQEKAFAAAPLGSLFIRFKNALISACQADARLEYLDRGEQAARSAWARADELETAFRAELEKHHAPTKP